MDAVKQLNTYVKNYKTCAFNETKGLFEKQEEATESSILTDYLKNNKNKSKTVYSTTKYADKDGYEVTETHNDDGSYTVEKIKKEKKPFLFFFKKAINKETFLEDYDSNGNLIFKFNLNQNYKNYKCDMDAEIYNEDGDYKYDETVQYTDKSGKNITRQEYND